MHVQVGAFHVTDPLLDEAWGVLAEAGTPVVLHAGSRPGRDGVHRARSGRRAARPAPAAGAGDRAHGGPGVRRVPALAETHERVRLDTTMAFTDFFTDMGGVYPADLLPRLARPRGPKVLLGSDFPNIPYPYLHQLESLAGLGLGDDWLRAVCWENGSRLLGA